MTDLFLIRHAPHGFQGIRLVGRTPGISLPEPSVRIAARLAERLAGEGITALYSSPLERARETAAVIGGRLGLEAVVCADADEVDYGEWTGRTFDELRPLKLWRRYNVNRSATRIPGGETMLEVQARMVALIERLRAEHPDGRIALVSHGDPIRSAILFYLGVSLDLIHRIEVAPASVSVLAITDWGGRLMRLNDLGADRTE